MILSTRNTTEINWICTRMVVKGATLQKTFQQYRRICKQVAELAIVKQEIKNNLN